MSNKDQLLRFLFENTPVRGELVQLQSTWSAMLERHDYPATLRVLLGEALAATVLLGATLKFNGSMVLQIQGSGPINLLVIQYNSDGTVRGTADWSDVPEQTSRLTELFQDGHLAITIDPSDQGERYQGIVDLGHGGIREAIEGYFQQSEQLNTQIFLATDDQCATGLMIQEMPQSQGTKDLDAWNRISHLSETIRDSELMDLDMREIIHRLYHQEDVRVFEPELIHFRCTCSKERIVDMLRNLGQAEVQSILEEEGKVSVSCEYCKQVYEFDVVDAEQIFASAIPTNPPKTKH